MKIEPLHNFIMIEPTAQEKKTDAGIVLPDSIGEPSTMQGTIVAAGPGVFEDKAIVGTGGGVSQSWYNRRPMSVKVGDKVLFKKTKFEKAEIDGKEVYLGNEENLWAKITE